MSYADDIAGVALDLAADGAAVSFTRDGGSVNAITGATSETETTATSVAIARRPSGAELARMKALELVLVQSIVLVVAAANLSITPTAQDRVTWAGLTYTVRDVAPFAPDGTPILYTVIATR